MPIPQEQVQCVLWLAELQSFTAIQRRFRRQYGRQPPTRKSIRFWNNKLKTTSSLFRVKYLKKMSTALERHPSEVRANQFVLLACSYVQIPRSTVHDVLHKRLRLRAYKIQMNHALKPSDHVARRNFAVDMLEGSTTAFKLTGNSFSPYEQLPIRAKYCKLKNY
jgi:hypothetical protein